MGLGHWADGLVRVCVWWLCICGLAALAADGLYALESGGFETPTPYSVWTMRLLAPLGVLGSLAALIGRPTRPLFWAVGVVLLLLFIAAVWFSWMI